jgi:CRISPR system Cascade subunit CasD
MTTLLLRLAAPLQSWGDSSRFERRETRPEPTKSGVLGLLAAAQGRRRSEPVEDLVALRFGVRVDQEGQLERDFHTAEKGDHKSSHLSYRFYLSDAVFVAGVEGDAALLEGIASSLRSPAFPLFLGRRSCPPSGRVLLGVFAGDVETALRSVPWQAAPHVRRAAKGPVSLRIIRDALPDEVGTPVRDVPVSFDPVHRQHAWRQVVDVPPVVFGTPRGGTPADPHDPMALLEV